MTFILLQNLVMAKFDYQNCRINKDNPNTNNNNNY